jgi:hypothetical protein
MYYMALHTSSLSVHWTIRYNWIAEYQDHQDNLVKLYWLEANHITRYVCQGIWHKNRYAYLRDKYKVL